MSASRSTSAAITKKDIRRVCGDISDLKVAELLASGASISELEKASAWVANQENLGGDRIIPEGQIGDLCEVLIAGDEGLLEDREG
jgi:hypothetical protein